MKAVMTDIVKMKIALSINLTPGWVGQLCQNLLKIKLDTV